MSSKFTAILAFSIVLTGCVNNSVSTTKGSVAAPTDDPQLPVDPNQDPLASYAWHLENTGQKTFSAGAASPGQDISVKDVHASYGTGSSVRIAVSDTGIDLTHPDLSPNELPTFHRSYASDVSSTWHGSSPAPIEGDAHGTAVTGLAAAKGWNGIGARGIAPNAKYAGFLFIGNFMSIWSSYESKIIDQMSGSFDIFNYSYGYPGCTFSLMPSSVLSAYQNGVNNLRNGRGAIYVKAAGNDFIGDLEDCGNNSGNYLGNTNTSEDQNVPYVILAAAVNASGRISSYSTPGSGLWVSALGGEYGTSAPAMLTTDITGCSAGISKSSSAVSGFNRGSLSSNSRCDYTSIMNGTSAAAPVLSGVIALMLEANPSLSWRDVKHILAVSADKINFSTAALTHPGGLTSVPAGHIYDHLYVTNGAGHSFSNTYGFGRVNAERAVEQARSYVSQLGPYLEHETSSASLTLSIPDNSATGASVSLTPSTPLIIESVQIRLTTDHSFIGDLGVELTSPSGVTSRLLLANSNIHQAGLSDYTLITNAFYGENSAGAWTLKLVDGASDDTGRLLRWTLKINGHAP